VSKHFFRLRDLGHAGIWSILHGAGKREAAESAQGCLQGVSVPLLFAEHAPGDRLLLTLAVRGMGGNEIYFGPGEWPGAECTAQRFVFDCGGPLCAIGGLTVNALERTAADCACAPTNGGGPDAHPCRLLADLALMHTRRPDMSATRIAWVGGAGGLAHSLVEAAMYIPFELFMALPEGGEPDRELLSLAFAAGAKIFLTRDIPIALDGAHFVYIGSGQAGAEDGDLQIDGKFMEPAQPDAQVLLARETGRRAWDMPEDCTVLERERFAMHLQVQGLIWQRMLCGNIAEG